MSNIIHHTNNIVQIKVPLPFPLQWVNSYLLKEENEYTLIDPGLNTDTARSFWQQVLEQIGLTASQIKRILLTHHHPDHYGLAGWFQEVSGCPVYMAKAGYEQAQLLWGDRAAMTGPLCELFTLHGLDAGLVGQMRAHMEDFTALVSPQPQVKYMEEGDQWNAEHLRFDTIAVSGHAMNHLIFIDEGNRLMLCGDHVLPRISPNISYFPGGDPDPLASFLQGLKKLGEYEVDIVYPGHRDPFTNLKSRVQELLEHHERRLEQMLNLMDTPMTAFEVCAAMFGMRLSIHQLRFALSETIAHLIYLENRGKLHRNQIDQHVTFSR